MSKRTRPDAQDGGLSAALLKRLMNNPSASSRAAVAAAVALEYCERGTRTGGSPSELAFAEELLLRLAEDAAELVRRALAEHLKGCSRLPAGLARRLADDVETVALPIIRYSAALSHSDLLLLAENGSEAKVAALAERSDLPREVVRAIVERGPGPAVQSLLGNEGASLSEEDWKELFENFGDDAAVQACLLARPRLPLPVVETLAERISDDLLAGLMERHGLPAAIAAKLCAQGRESAVLRALSRQSSEAEISALIAALSDSERLTPTLIMRALLTGELFFFDAALARRAGLPLEEARRLLLADPGSLRQVLARARVPQGLLEPIHAVMRWRRELGSQRVPPGLSFFELVMPRLCRECRDIAPGSLERVMAEIEWLCRRDPFLPLPA